MTENIALLEVRNIEVEKGGVKILDIPFFSVNRGETVSIIGPNGAGKTTLLQTLGFLLRSFQGEIFFKGRKIDSNQSIFEYRRKISLVFDEPLLFDTTVFNNVASGLKIRGLKRDEIKKKVMEELERFRISHLYNRSARTLSAGEARRTCLARAFVTGPEILFLDEPFSTLDPPSRDSIIEDLRNILSYRKVATLLTTHDRSEAIALSNRIAVMNGGKIIQIGKPEEIINRPADEFVASFVGIETIISGRVVQSNSGTFITSVNGKEIEAVGNANLGENVVLCIRPENVIISTYTSKVKTSARNVFKGKILKILPMGLFQKIQLDCGFPLTAYITNHSLKELALKEGNEVQASFKATAVSVIKKSYLE